MPKTILKSPNLSGGLSTQPPQVRFPNQVNQALNASFSVFDGANKRPGTVHVCAPSSMPSSGDYRMFPIIRDSVKKFVAVFGSSPGVRVFRVSDGAEMTVTISTDAAAYLAASGAEASDFRLITVTDTSFILNTKKPVSGVTSPAYTVDFEYEDYDAMVAAFPVYGSHCKTRNDTQWAKHGYYISHGSPNFVRVPAPSDPNQTLDKTTMPVKLVHNSGDTFTCDTIEWVGRNNGENANNPAPFFASSGLPISDMVFYRDRLVFTSDEHISFSQSGSIYDFYLADDQNIVESDPIDVQISGARVSKIRYIVPFGKRLVFDTEAHQQFELTDTDKLTYETVAITPTTQIESTQTRPLPIGLSLFIMGNTADARQMMEYVYDDIRAGSDASDVGEHVKGLLPEEVRSLVGSSNARVVLAVQGDGPRIMAYSFFWNGNQKQQAAWGLWELVGDAAIHDAAGIGTDAFLLVARGDGMVIEKLPMSSFTDAGETPIHMDRQYTIDPGGDAAGVYTNDGYTTWEAPTVDGGWDTAVLVGSEWGTDENRVLPLKRNVADANNEVFTFGRFNVAGGKVVLGQAYTMRLEVSRPFRRDQTGQAILGEKLNAMRWVVEVRRTSDLSLKSVDDSTSHLAREVRFVKETPSDGRIQAWFGGDVDRMKLVIESAGPKPATVTGWELEAMTGRR